MMKFLTKLISVYTNQKNSRIHQSKLNKLKIEEFLVTQTDLNKTERDKILRKIDLEQDPYKKIRKMYEDYQFDINNKEAYKNIIEQRGKYTFTDYIVDNANKYQANIKKRESLLDSPLNVPPPQNTHQLSL